MADEVGICNSALRKIGADTIVSLTQNNKNALVCNDIYEPLRDELLEGHNWNFAVKRQKLGQVAAEPAFGFDHAYALPADYLRLVSVHGNDAGAGPSTGSGLPYRIESDRRLSSSADALWLRYVSRVTDVNLMTPLFREALAFRLAADLAVPIAQSRGLSELMDGRFRAALRRAKSADSMQDFPDEMPDSAWVSERSR